jgi:hypothetical protein
VRKAFLKALLDHELRRGGGPVWRWFFSVRLLLRRGKGELLLVDFLIVVEIGHEDGVVICSSVFFQGCVG